MAQIQKRFVYYSSFDAFETQLANGGFDKSCVVFVNDFFTTPFIYNRGVYYGKDAAEWHEPSDCLTDEQYDAFLNGDKFTYEWDSGDFSADKQKKYVGLAIPTEDYIRYIYLPFYNLEPNSSFIKNICFADLEFVNSVGKQIAYHVTYESSGVVFTPKAIAPQYKVVNCTLSSGPTTTQDRQRWVLSMSYADLIDLRVGDYVKLSGGLSYDLGVVIKSFQNGTELVFGVRNTESLNEMQYYWYQATMGARQGDLTTLNLLKYTKNPVSSSQLPSLKTFTGTIEQDWMSTTGFDYCTFTAPNELAEVSNGDSLNITLGSTTYSVGLVNISGNFILGSTHHSDTEVYNYMVRKTKSGTSTSTFQMRKIYNALGGGGGSQEFLTQAEYDALATKDSNTLYFITE